MSDSSSSSDPNDSYVCKICGLAFLTQDLALHIDFEHIEKEHPGIL